VSLFVRPSAAADIEDAHFWHESQRVGLGDEFLDVVSLVLEVLQDSPRRYRVVHRDTRRGNVRRFPHGLSIESSTLTLLSSPASTRVEIRVVGKCANDVPRDAPTWPCVTPRTTLSW
jgi:hypothetical protein